MFQQGNASAEFSVIFHLHEDYIMGAANTTVTQAHYGFLGFHDQVVDGG